VSLAVRTLGLGRVELRRILGHNTGRCRRPLVGALSQLLRRLVTRHSVNGSHPCGERGVDRAVHRGLYPGRRPREPRMLPGERKRRMTTDSAEQELGRVADLWAAAELRGETAALREMLVDDFVGIGPRGFTLTREQWLTRHESGDLVHESLGLEDVGARVYGKRASRLAVKHRRHRTRERLSRGSFAYRSSWCGRQDAGSLPPCNSAR